MPKSGTPEVIPQWAIPQMTPTKGYGPPTPLPGHDLIPARPRTGARRVRAYALAGLD
jgi:hypothetical protein